MIKVEQARDEYIIRIKSNLITLEEINKWLDKLRLKEIIAKSQMTEEDIKKLDEKVKMAIWEKWKPILKEKLSENSY
ncbi:MAG: hypothetical protein LWW78_05255 [Deltaproteobacteria bacterium]|nr:hypothetical protein [Deltaproteobacteria bacterium]